MTDANHAYRCEYCGRGISREQIAAVAVDEFGIYGDTPDTRIWCVDCWDHEPIAVEQYRTLGEKGDPITLDALLARYAVNEV